MRVLNQTARVLTREIGVCDTRIRRVSHAFTVKLVAGLNRSYMQFYLSLVSCRAETNSHNYSIILVIFVNIILVSNTCYIILWRISV